MIKIEMLRCFAVVAETGNLADAAARLGRTQSAVSMTLKRLEEHLGRQLFENERKNRLTSLGYEVFSLAQKQLRQFDETVGSIEIAASAPKGLLRVAAIPSASGLIMPDAIFAMNTRHPALKVVLRDMDSDQVIDSLVHGQADLGIVSGIPKLNDVEQKLLFEDRFGVVCSAAHELVERSNPPHLMEVFDPSFVKNNLCTLIEDPIAQAALENTSITVQNTHSLIAMVRTGKWVTILPQTVALIFPSELSFVPILGLRQKRPISLLVRRKTVYPELADEFASVITENAKKKFSEVTYQDDA